MGPTKPIDLEEKMVFIGTTRFSLFKPDSGAWRSSANGAFSSPEQYKEYLFSPRRIEPRMKILREVSLPNLAVAAESHTIRHIIHYSPELPSQYLRQLEALQRDFPFVVLSDASDSTGARHPYTIANELNPHQKPYVIYRLDDDDFLSTSYFDQLAPLVSEANLGFRVSLAAGLTGIFDGERFSTIRYSYKPYIAIGLAGIYGRNSQGQFVAPAETAHNLSDRVGTVMVDATECSYFWTRHAGQDTDFGKNEGFDVTRKEVASLPPIPTNWNLFESFPSLRDHTDSLSRSEVISDSDVSEDGKPLRINATGRFSLLLDATFPDGMQANAGLISFQIERDGVPTDDIEVQGMTRSPNPTIGQYRYITTYAGRRSNQFDFELPPGCEVIGARITPFGALGKPFHVNSLYILQ